MPTELRAEERGRDVAVGILDHRHHHQTRHDERHVRHAIHVLDARADELAKDHEIQRHCDRRWNQRLRPDPQNPRHLATRDRVQRGQVGAHGIFDLCIRVHSDASG